MGIARSTYYDGLARAGDDTALVETMHGIKDEFHKRAAVRARVWRRQGSSEIVVVSSGASPRQEMMVALRSPI